MFKNYIFINIILALVLTLLALLAVNKFMAPVDTGVPPLPTVAVNSTPPAYSNATNPQNETTAQRITPRDFSMVYEKNLFHPERKLPEREHQNNTPNPTPTTFVFDCSQTGISLSGIVHVEKQKPYCFLKHAKETENQVKVFHLGETLGDYTIAEIKDDAIVLQAKNGSTCEMKLFDFSQKQAKPRYTPRSGRRRPTPVRRSFRPSR